MATVRCPFNFHTVQTPPTQADAAVMLRLGHALTDILYGLYGFFLHPMSITLDMRSTKLNFCILLINSIRRVEHFSLGEMHLWRK